jgi:chromosome segregation ATPase
VSPAAQESIRHDVAEKIRSLMSSLGTMAPNMKALEHLEDVKKKLASADAELEDSKRASREAAEKFDQVKRERFAGGAAPLN